MVFIVRQCPGGYVAVPYTTMVIERWCVSWRSCRPVCSTIQDQINEALVHGSHLHLL
jgi:hypothetical protein